MKKIEKYIYIVIALIIGAVLASTVTYMVASKNGKSKLRELITKGYSVLNLDNIDLTEDLESITTEQYFNFDKMYTSIIPWNNDIFSYELNDGVAFFKYNDIKYNIQIQNVKKIFSFNNGCVVGSSFYYLLDESGNLYYLSQEEVYHFKNYANNKNINEYLNGMATDFKKVESDFKYEDAFVAWGFADTCAHDFNIIGVTKDNKKIVVEDGSIYEKSNDSDYLIFESLTIKTDRTINAISDKKIKVFIHDEKNSKIYVVTEENKLYELKNESSYKPEQVKDVEIKNVLYKNTSSKYYKDIIILFNDNDKLEIKESRLKYEWNKSDYKYHLD